MSKLIQIVPQQDTETQQGALWGLADDGTIWIFENGAWSKFYAQLPLEAK